MLIKCLDSQHPLKSLSDMKTTFRFLYVQKSKWSNIVSFHQKMFQRTHLYGAGVQILNSLLAQTHFTSKVHQCALQMRHQFALQFNCNAIVTHFPPWKVNSQLAPVFTFHPRCPRYPGEAAVILPLSKTLPSFATDMHFRGKILKNLL